MTNPDHTPANRLIAATFHDDSVGFSGKHTIKRIDIELPANAADDKKVRAICVGSDGKVDTVIDIAEAGSIIDIAAYLGREFAISRKYVMDRYDFRCYFDKRFVEAEEWNDLQRRECQDIVEYVAGNIIYSVVSRAAYRVAKSNDETKEYGPVFECYAQKLNDSDPDTNLVGQEAFSNMFDAMVWVRNRVEKSIITALMPEVKL